MIFETADLDPKLKTRADLVSKLQCAPIFMKSEHANYELTILIIFSSWEKYGVEFKIFKENRHVLAI